MNIFQQENSDLSVEVFLERVTGIEPVSSAWKAEIIAVIPHPLGAGRGN